LLLLNIQGVNSSTKLTLFEQYIDSMKKPPSVIALCESWLSADDVKCLNFKNYSLASSFGRKGSNRGGVVLLVNKTSGLKWKVIKTKSTESTFETCSIVINIENRKIQLILIYRPSNAQNNSQLQSFFINLENLLADTIEPDKEIILLGDLNIDILKSNSESNQLMDIMTAYQFNFLNAMKPTRSFNGSQSLIDHIFANFQSSFLTEVLPIDFSDHDAVSCKFDIKYKLPKDKWVYNRLYSDENWQYFFECLLHESWTDTYAAVSIHDKSKAFMEKLICHFNVAFPIKKTLIRGNRHNKHNLSEHTKYSQIELRKIGEQLSATKDKAKKATLRQSYNSLKKYVGFCINNDKKRENEKKIQQSSNKGKAAWNLIKNIEGKTFVSTQIESLLINDHKENDIQLIIDHLNEQFIEDTPNIEDLSLVYDDVFNLNDLKFTLDFTSEFEILEIIAKFQSKNSSSWDGISTRVLKRIALFIAAPLCHLVNESFSQGAFPDNLKMSVITPLFKKGERCDPKNYRPIAMSSPISKVIEKAFLNRLESYFESNDLLTPKQHGFRKNKSTVTALFDLVTEIYNSVENREKVNVILYDFKNAFGRLVPDILVNKLKKYGLDELSLSWVKSFLIDRKQYVQLKTFDENNVQKVYKSEVLSSSMGVPQGTTLGPFGWNTYSNDFPLHILLASLIIFADDSTAIVKGKTFAEVNDKTVETNRCVVNFAEQNFLKLNASKTNILQIHTHQTRNIVKPEVQINDQNVETCNDGKILGVYLTDTMNWKKQCEHVVSKLRSVCFLFTMLRCEITENLLRQVYFAYVQSHILYSIVIWGGSPHLERVSVAQKRVLRAMAGVRFHWNPDQVDSCRPLFKKYNILPVFSIYILECAKFVKKYPEKFSLARDNQNSRVYNTRNRVVHDCDLYVKQATLQMTAQDPNVMIARIFNHLPLALKLEVCEKHFVSSVKNIVEEMLFYDKSEYFGHKFC
jgi:exonuclease III